MTATLFPVELSSPIYAAIHKERERQEKMWGRDHEWGSGSCANPDLDPLVKLAVLTEEVGEVAAALLDKEPKELKVELVQVAAVAVAWLESL